jgi:hypothetical protein
MGLGIKHDEVEREGATPLTDEEMARRGAAVRALQDKIARDGIDWSRSEDDILGYDRDGLTEQPHHL